MGEEPAAPLFFAPFVSSTMQVEPGWLDYNGHLNMAYYHVLFDRATDEALALLGLGPDYLREENASYFVAEIHTLYKRELGGDDAVRVTFQLIDHNDKGMHHYLEIRHAAEDFVAASCEVLSLHVDMATRKVAPFPARILAALAAMKAAHADLPRPPVLGRVIHLRR